MFPWWASLHYLCSVATPPRSNRRVFLSRVALAPARVSGPRLVHRSAGPAVRPSPCPCVCTSPRERAARTPVARPRSSLVSRGAGAATVRLPVYLEGDAPRDTSLGRSSVPLCARAHGRGTAPPWPGLTLARCRTTASISLDALRSSERGASRLISSPSQSKGWSGGACSFRGLSPLVLRHDVAARS